MALSGLQIYKLLPKKNCRECGFPTCLAFAMQLAKKAVDLDKCPYLNEEAKKTLQASSLPPIRLVTIGKEEPLRIGNETVLFRHEEKFHHPPGIGIILEDNYGLTELKEKLAQIKKLKFERVGQCLKIELIALKHTSGREKFLRTLKTLVEEPRLKFVLMCEDSSLLKETLKIAGSFRPVIYSANKDNWQEFGALAKEFNCPLVVSHPDLSVLSELTEKLNAYGVEDILLDTGRKSLKDRIWDLVQIRRLSLKKNIRSLEYPCLSIVENEDSFQEIIEASVLIAKYAGIILLRAKAPWQILALLTVRQNIYSDPQKPLQVEPKLYSVGQPNELSPLLVTTNFSLTYYTVLTEVEASKVPSYILSIDTEGMSVLTAWAAEKFTAESITNALKNIQSQNLFKHKKLIIPGYVAVLSGDLEEKSGWKVVVGPREAAGLVAFLRNLKLS